MKIAVSACLLGDNVRYDATNRINHELIDILKDHDLIKICPELAANLSIPRDRIERLNNKIITINNIDITKQLVEGCLKCLELIKDCDCIILKSKSPSCGYKKIYDGSFNNILIEGNGLFTDMCLKQGYKVFSELDIELIKEYVR